MTAEQRHEQPAAWAVGWWPVRDASEAVLWRPVDRSGWTYRAEGDAWSPVERVPPRARVWAHRHGFADAGALDVFEFPAQGDDVPGADARPLRRWPMLAPSTHEQPAPAASVHGEQMGDDFGNPKSPAAHHEQAPDLEPPAPPEPTEAAEQVAHAQPAAPYVPPPSTALPPRARRSPTPRIATADVRDRRRREVDAVRRALSDPEDVAARLGLCDGREGHGKGAGWVREGTGVKVRCPWHADGTPSCSITRGPDGTVRVKCHGCQASGDVFHLVAVMHGVDLRARFRDVLGEAATMAGVRIGDPHEALPPPIPRAAPAEQVAEADAEFIATAAALLVVAPLDADDAADVRAYLDGRGILAGALADGWGALPSTPEGLARVRREVIAATSEGAWARSGLASRDGWWTYPANRVVIPWRDASGRLTWLQRRSLGGEGTRYVARKGSGATAPYGAERLAAQGDDPVAITEGAVDALALRAACEREGVPAVILGAPGTNWRGSWCSMLAGRDVAIASDDDAAGDSFAARIAPDIQRVARSVQRWRPTGAKDWCAAWQTKTG